MYETYEVYDIFLNSYTFLRIFMDIYIVKTYKCISYVRIFNDLS